MNILFAGTSFNSSKILNFLDEIDDVNVIGVITKPDKPGKRGSNLIESPVSSAARNADINLFKPEQLDCIEFKETISKLEVDILVVVAYGKILPEWMLNIPKMMPINIHYSLLPFYRGSSPIQASIINGDKHTGVTFMKMNKSLDEGEIINKFECKILHDDNKTTLEKKLTEISIKEISGVLKLIKTKKVKLLDQKTEDVSYCKKIIKSDSLIDFSESSSEIFNKFKAYIEWPGLTFKYKNTLIKIHGLKITDEDSSSKAGTINKITKSGLYINTVDKLIVITNLQFPNKKIIKSEDVFNSYKQFFS